MKEYVHLSSRKDVSAFSILTARERGVLQKLAEGRSAKEIAYALNISSKTIEAARQKIGENLGLRGSKKGSPSSFCLQHLQNPSTLFPLRSFTPFGTESLCLGGLEGVFPGGGLTKGAVPGVFTAIQQKCLSLAFKW